MFKLKPMSFAALMALSLAMSVPASAKIETGSQLSDMTVIDSNGVSHKLSDFSGKNIVLEWTNHGCPYVKKHYSTQNMQAMQKMATADDDTVWLSVISSAPGKQGYVTGTEANALTTSRSAVPTAVVLDPEGIVGRAFSAQTTPHMFIVDANQTLVYQGAIDDNRSANPATVAGARNHVKEALMNIKAGKAVIVSETAPYGCSIKYGS